MIDSGSPPIVVTHERGARYVARIRSHDVPVDQPLRGGGEDSAPTPLELLGASLGSCVALYVRKFLIARKLDTEGLRVEVHQHDAENPHRIGEFDVKVILAHDVPSVYRPMIEAVTRVCPSHNTLAHGAAVNVEIEFPALVG